MMMRVAYQGERGAFSETAARRLMNGELMPLPRRTFEEMFAAVAEGDADCCVVPIENSLAGSIHRNYDLLLESKLAIAGETNLRIEHNVIARAGVPLDAIRKVYSHPVALAQCGRFLRAHAAMEATPVHDTAGAVRMILERGRDDEAAIASADAAEIYGGQIIARGVEDHAQNFTRFLLLMSPGDAESFERTSSGDRWKTSIIFRVANRPGALHQALGAFAMFDVDLAKIESRPVEGRPWEYAFYADVVGRRNDHRISRALDNLGAIAEELHVFGSYATKW
jgi:prephenate dehydratase